MIPKLVSYQQLSRLRKRFQRTRKRVVFTNGCFDVLHVGHVDYLARARKLGDVLVVGLNSDRSVRKIKGPKRPLNSERDRARVLAALEPVNAIVLFGEATPVRVIRALRPNVLVKGADWAAKDIAGRAELRSWGGTLRRIPLVKGRSTSKLIQKINRL
jgi:rfaE bifunctional protein nucleotidyltransferase chain/domain